MRYTKAGVGTVLTIIGGVPVGVHLAVETHIEQRDGACSSTETGPPKQGATITQLQRHWVLGFVCTNHKHRT